MADGVTNLTELHIDALSLDGTALTATAGEVNELAGKVAGVTYTIGSEAANVINVGLQLEDQAGDDLAARACVFAYLSDDANGNSNVATAPDGGWAIGTDGLLISVVDNKAAFLVSEVDGDIDIDITHAAGAKTVYLIVVTPTGNLLPSAAITFA